VRRKARAGSTQGVELGVFLGVHEFSKFTQLARTVETEPLTNDMYTVNTTPGGGVPLGVRLGFRLAPRVAFELEGEAQYVETRDQRGDGVVFGYRGLVQVRLAGASSRFRPFLAAGGGGHSAIIARSSRTVTDTIFVGAAGGGIELAINRGWALRFDVRALVGAGDEGESFATDVEVLVGFCWSGSGACGYEAPARNLGAVGDGGPPQRDSDEDGVFGDADKCPITPEDADGVQDDDGCPDLDDDSDGVAEPGDRCPQEPENVNGWDDFDGCPEELPEDLAPFDGVVAGVKFREATAVFDRGTFDALDALVAALAAHPEASIRIVVTVGRLGDENLEAQLSEERAEAVFQYLADAGVARERMSAVGKGAGTADAVEIRFVAAPQ